MTSDSRVCRRKKTDVGVCVLSVGVYVFVSTDLSSPESQLALFAVATTMCNTDNDDDDDSSQTTATTTTVFAPKAGERERKRGNISA